MAKFVSHMTRSIASGASYSSPRRTGIAHHALNHLILARNGFRLREIAKILKFRERPVIRCFQCQCRKPKSKSSRDSAGVLSEMATIIAYRNGEAYAEGIEAGTPARAAGALSADASPAACNQNLKCVQIREICE